MSKVIAVMEKPTNCQKCVFSVCKYSLPLSTRRKGYCCQLHEPQDRVVEDFAFEEDVHLSNCPLYKATTENTPTEHITWQSDIPSSNEYKKGYEDGWNECLHTIRAGLPYQKGE